MKNKRQNGYAVLFTMLIIGSLSVIIAGISNAALKQTILSSLFKDSQIALYQADIALDCALYADLVKDNGTFFASSGTWSCGGVSLNITPVNDGFGSYKLESDSGSNDPCFSIDVTKQNPNTTIEIKVFGYNICNKNNPRVVERSMGIQYIN